MMTLNVSMVDWNLQNIIIHQLIQGAQLIMKNFLSSSNFLIFFKFILSINLVSSSSFLSVYAL